MSDIINLDFESRSEIDLKKYGLDRYSADRSTEIIMSSWSVNGGAVQYWDITHSKRPPAELREALADPAVTKWAFNAQFERIMTLRRWGIETPYESWRCTMILAYMLGFSGDLAMIGKAMGLPQDKLKLDEGKKLIQMFCKPKKPTKNQPYRWFDALTHPDEWEGFGAYNRQDVVTEMAIKAKLDRDKYPVPEREWHMYAIDQRINDRGVQIDTHFARQAIALAERRKPAIITEMKAVTGCANPGSTPQLLPWLQDNGYPFQDLRAETVKKVIRESDHNGIEPIAVDVLRMRQNSNKSSLAKYQTMLDASGEDGRFRFSLQFHGASRTGRWAGRRIQTQNLPRTPKALEDIVPLGWANEMIRAGDLSGLQLLNGEPMDTLVGCIRSAFVPGEGKKFVVCDLSSIESVVIGWMTGCKWFMDTLAAGHDLYRAFAGEWLNLPYEETKPHRSKAKPATLGAGYRLGGGDLLDDGKKTGLWAYGENMGVFMTKEEAHSSVQAFRDLCPEIVQTWYALENAVKRCLSTKQDVKVIRRCDDGPDYELPLVIEFRKPFLCIKLPSGRRLYYFDPKMEQRTMKGKDGEEYTKANFSYMSKPMQGNGWVRVYSHGGKLVENCLTSDTVVVTSNGNKPLCEVDMTDLLWDGVEWVSHDGVIAQGVKEVGVWLGIELTSNHKILGSSGWKPVVEMDNDTTLSALQLAQDSVNLPSFGLNQEKAEEPDCGVIAGKISPSSQIKCISNAQHDAEAVRYEIETRRKSQPGKSKTKIYGASGHIDGAASCRDAEIQNVEPIKIMAVEESTSVSNGQKAETNSSTMPVPVSQTGTTKEWTSIESTMKKGTSPVTSDWSSGSSITGIGGQTSELNIKGDCMLSLSSATDTSQKWPAAPFTGTSKTVNPQNRSWRYTGQKPVFDIVNAGPRHRFTVVSNEGVVIVHNCVQAIARDVLAIGMSRVDKHGLTQEHLPWDIETVMHIHDELVNEVDIEADDEQALAFVHRCMTAPISWAPGLPLGAAGFVGSHYRKD